jgi:CDP-glycerol glycerophosphotransferase (TagB/SpsB family)
VTTIFFTSFYGFISRNIFSTDVLGVLKQRGDVRAVIFVPFYKKSFFDAHYGSENVIIEPIDTAIVVGSRRNQFFATLFTWLLRSFTLEYRKKERLSRERNVRGYCFYGLSRTVTALFGRSRTAHAAARALERRICPASAFRQYFDRYQPRAVFATDLFHDMDAALLREAKARRVTTIGMVRSWDNNTTRGLCRVLPDVAVVNNPIIADELVELQGMARDRIFVGGIPQFDRYVPARRTSRKEFFARIEADPARRLILFAPAGEQLSDADEQVMDMLADALATGRLPADLQFLVRMHPGCPASLERFAANPLFRIEAPGVRFPERIKDTELTPADAEHLADSLFYSEVVIHVSSSLGLDAVMFDKPQIMIEFDGSETKPYLQSVKRYHDEDHMKRFIETGVAHIAESFDDLVAAINAYLENPQLDSQGRARGRDQQCWRVDGGSGARIGRFVAETLGLPAPAPEAIPEPAAAWRE